MSDQTPYDRLCAHRRVTATLASGAHLQGWDQEACMPPAGAPARGEQQALIASLAHERSTSRELNDLIAACESDRQLTGDPDSPAARNIARMRRDYSLATKLPSELVAEIARTSARAQVVWREAREKSDFSIFEPWLDKAMGLARRKAECYGTPAGGEPYDALINEYEPDAKAADIEAVFTPLGERLSELVRELAASGGAPSDACLKVKIPQDRQHAFGLFVIEQLGFDLNAGRLDVVTHPFCSDITPGDVRLTTRYNETHFTDALYGTMHECGHGLYEQGLVCHRDISMWGQPLSEAISLGIHESQSRMWENFVGRSREFWAWAMPHAKRILGSALEPFSADDMYRAVNRSDPSYIRVEADESTYNLHIMVRFEMERALLSGNLAVKDVPGVWNETFERYLGIPVPDDRRGCLQDVHWSHGLIGYFPTYCLGNLYAAQLWEKINEDLPDLPDQMGRGEFGALLSWLRENIHQHGRRYNADELCMRVTGRPLDAEPLMRHLEGKLRPVYGV